MLNHTQDGVHRRAYLVGHIVKEGALRRVGGAGLLESLVEPLLLVVIGIGGKERQRAEHQSYEGQRVEKTYNVPLRIYQDGLRILQGHIHVESVGAELEAQHHESVRRLKEARCNGKRENEHGRHAARQSAVYKEERGQAED